MHTERWITRAKIVLYPYRESGEEVGTAIRDLLSDMMHLAEHAEVDFQAELEVAERNYLAERAK
jgi:hypothetical protein